jgi:hypothetical protein
LPFLNIKIEKMKMKFLLTTVPLLALVMHFNPAFAQQKNESRKTETRSSVNLRSVTTGESGETLIDYQDDVHRHKIRMKESKIVEMYVDGKKVPEQDFSKYDAVVKKILLQVEKDREQADKDRIQADKDRQQADRDRDQADLDRQQADKDREQMKVRREKSEADRFQYEKDRERLVQEKKEIQNEREQTEISRNQATRDRERAAMDTKQAEKDRSQAGRDREQADRDRSQAELDRKQADADRKLMEAMINEVVTEKMADNKEAIKSLILSDTELLVNGIKQSDSLHNKFKTKYLKKAGNRISYKNSGGSKGISID